jgi:hypothetical protein
VVAVQAPRLVAMEVAVEWPFCFLKSIRIQRLV